MAEQGDPLRSRADLVFPEAATNHRDHTERLEEVGGRADTHLLRSVADRQEHRLVSVRGDVLQRGDLIFQGVEDRVRDQSSVPEIAQSGIVFPAWEGGPDVDQPVGVRIGRRFDEYTIDDGVYGGDRTDADRQDEDRRGRKEEPLSQAAQHLAQSYQVKSCV